MGIVLAHLKIEKDLHRMSFASVSHSALSKIYPHYAVLLSHVPLYRRRLRRTTAAPCLWTRLCGQMLGLSLAKVLYYVFPQPLWKPLGEHFGWRRKRKRRRRRPLGGLLGPSWGLLGASWEPPEGLSGALGGLLWPLWASWAVLRRSWPV